MLHIDLIDYQFTCIYFESFGTCIEHIKKGKLEER